MRKSEEHDAVSTAAPSVVHRTDGRVDPVGKRPRPGVAGVPRRSPAVPRYKAAAITWLAVYPALTVTLALLGPALAPLPLFLRTLVVTVVLVPIVVYVLVPGMQRLFARWLRPPAATHANAAEPRPTEPK